MYEQYYKKKSLKNQNHVNQCKTINWSKVSENSVSADEEIKHKKCLQSVPA